MKETTFNSIIYKYFVIILLILMVFWNVYTYLYSDSNYSLIKASFQFLVLILIFFKSQYAKTGIAIFGVLLIINSSFSFIGGLIKIYFDQNLMNLILTVFVPIVLLILGIIVYHYNVTTVKVKMVQKKS